MIDLDTAKMHLTDTMDAAFTKSVGTKKQRAAMAKQCCRMVPTNSGDSISLLAWAIEYATNWKAA